MNIELETLELTSYKEQEHSFLKEELENGKSSSNYIHQISERLELSKDNNKNIYQRAFVILDESTPIYIKYD